MIEQTIAQFLRLLTLSSQRFAESFSRRQQRSPPHVRSVRAGRLPVKRAPIRPYRSAPMELSRPIDAVSAGTSKRRLAENHRNLLALPRRKV